MNLQVLFRNKEELKGILITGSIFLLFEIVIAHNFYASSFLLFLLALAFGSIIGTFVKAVQRKYDWATGGLIISLIYLPIFLSFLNDEPPGHFYFWMLILPGAWMLNFIVSPDRPGQAPIYHILVSLSGLLTLTMLFLLSVAVGLFFKHRKSRVRQDNKFLQNPL
jgi:hypothetical protein